jgi:hypothetical protein
LKSKLTLAAIVTILLVSLVGNVYFYSEQRDSTLRYAVLKEQASELRILTSNLENETAELEDQLNQLSQEGPKLVTRLGASDMRFNYTGQETRLYISGEIWNVGTSTARNCRLHVTLYQGDAVAKDTYVELGNIDVGSYVDVASNVYYTGNALTNWTLTPECN